jgi:hypothetical protein
VRLRAERRIPAVLDGGQVEAVLEACQRLRDRLLFTLLEQPSRRRSKTGTWTSFAS